MANLPDFHQKMVLFPLTFPNVERDEYRKQTGLEYWGTGESRKEIKNHQSHLKK